jgi:hypothetical protein
MCVLFLRQQDVCSLPVSRLDKGGIELPDPKRELELVICLAHHCEVSFVVLLPSFHVSAITCMAVRESGFSKPSL